MELANIKRFSEHDGRKESALLLKKKKKIPRFTAHVALLFDGGVL